MKPMTKEEKAREYYRIASDLIDYVWGCAERRVVPLKHDANLFLNRLERARRAEVDS